MKATPKQDPKDLGRYRGNYLIEMDGITLYHAMAAAEADEGRAAIFKKMALSEERHANRWARLLRAAGEAVPEYRPTARVRLLGWLARVFGTQKILPIVSGLEARDQSQFMEQPEAVGIPADERGHIRAIRALEIGATGQQSIMGRERWHFRAGGGSLRAAVFGVNDGLVSNFSLVMGFAGAEARPEYILLAGIAGLLAGAFSMGAGEYISMRAQRESFEQQIAMEKQELEMAPEEEEEELSLIYQAKGVPEKEASALAHRIIQDPKTAVDTLAREELGLDPSELGSPWRAALSSFWAFVSGAFVPVVPYLVASGTIAIIGSASLSCLALFGVGALVSVFSSRGPWISGVRMLGIGILASAVTFSVGWLVGISTAG
ncbi:MAG: VIT1/CCC1 transporter family protein [Candidatus Binatia bacterium]